MSLKDLAFRTSVRALVWQLIQPIVRWGYLAVSTADGYDEMEGRGSDEEEEPYQHPVRRMQHYGFRSRPPVGAELCGVAPGACSAQRIYVASELPGVGPTDQAEGDVEVYGKAGQRVRLPAGAAGLYLDTTNGTAHLEGGRLTVTDDVAAKHYLGSSGKPTFVSLIPGVVNITSSAGSDFLFSVTFAIANNPVPQGTPVINVTFARTYAGGSPVALLGHMQKKISLVVTPLLIVINADEDLNPGDTVTVTVLTSAPA